MRDTAQALRNLLAMLAMLTAMVWCSCAAAAAPVAKAEEPLVLPPADTYTAALVETAINESGVPYVVQDEATGYGLPRADTIAVRHFRIQDNVAKAVSVGLYPAGAVNPSVVARVEKQEKEGGRQWK